MLFEEHRGINKCIKLNALIEEFGPFSGYKVNRDKSVLSRFNVTDKMKSEILDILQVNVRVSILNILILGCVEQIRTWWRRILSH